MCYRSVVVTSGSGPAKDQRVSLHPQPQPAPTQHTHQHTHTPQRAATAAAAFMSEVRDREKAAKQAELYASGGWVGSVAAWRQRQQHALLSASNLQQYSACA